MKQQTLIYLFRGDGGSREVLLGEKLRGFGCGNVMGPGGHVEPGETAAQAAVRELAEETGAVASLEDLTEVARLRFHFPAAPASNAQVIVFLAARWRGPIRASDELEPRWYPIDRIPLDRMWDDDRYWLPRVLAGERLAGDFTYDDAGTTVVDHRLQQL